ncbi:MAG: DNA-directed RNA polymerase subunit omega [Acidobacteria bacterium]|nr:MAG: DNA-directed RNA polymerase subunit omega [Acidobacteriota bacterium]
MAGADKSKSDSRSTSTHEEQWPGIDSHFRLIVVAALRCKQLLNGSPARIESDPLRRRNTSIALEEVRRGLVQFTTRNEEKS